MYICEENCILYDTHYLLKAKCHIFIQTEMHLISVQCIYHMMHTLDPDKKFFLLTDKI